MSDELALEMGYGGEEVDSAIQLLGGVPDEVADFIDVLEVVRASAQKQGKRKADQITMIPKHPRVSSPTHSAELPFDIRGHLVTINGHGGFGHGHFKLPDNIYVLVPHNRGLEKPYVLAGQEYEHNLYIKNRFDSTEGWHLYKPGDQIRNQAYSTLGRACPIKEAQEQYQKCVRKGHRFCCYFWGNMGHIAKCRTTILKRVTLENIVFGIRKHLNELEEDAHFDRSRFGMFRNMMPKHDDPIVLLPAACNSQSGSQRVVVRQVDRPNRSISDIFWEELRKRK